MMGVACGVVCRVPHPFVKAPVGDQARLVSYQAVQPVVLDLLGAAGSPPDTYFIDVPSPALTPQRLADHKGPCALVGGLRYVAADLCPITVKRSPPLGVSVDTGPMMPVRIPKAALRIHIIVKKGEGELVRVAKPDVQGAGAHSAGAVPDGKLIDVRRHTFGPEFNRKVGLPQIDLGATVDVAVIGSILQGGFRHAGGFARAVIPWLDCGV